MEQFLYLHRSPGPVSSLIISNQIVDILGVPVAGWLPLIKMTLRGEARENCTANIFSSPHSPLAAVQPLQLWMSRGRISSIWAILSRWRVVLVKFSLEAYIGFHMRRLARTPSAVSPACHYRVFCLPLLSSLLCLASSEKSCLCRDVITSYIKF